MVIAERRSKAGLMWSVREAKRPTSDDLSSRDNKCAKRDKESTGHVEHRYELGLHYIRRWRIRTRRDYQEKCINRALSVCTYAAVWPTLHFDAPKQNGEPNLWRLPAKISLIYYVVWCKNWKSLVLTSKWSVLHFNRLHGGPILRRKTFSEME